MSKTCECGGKIKRGMLGAECEACGRIVDGERTAAPCIHGERVSGVNRCISSRLPEAVAPDVYAHIASGNSCSMDGRCPAFDSNPDFGAPSAKEAAHGQWCVFLDKAGNCVQDTYELREDGSIIPDSMRNENIGKCPYRGKIRDQKNCSIASPDPSWPAPSWSPFEDYLKTGRSTAASRVEAHWKDVRDKATFLRRNGAVTIVRNDAEVIASTVIGEHDEYNVVLYKQGSDSHAVTTWECDCGWGDWAFKRQQTYVGRMCSHAYATLMEAQSQNMLGGGLWQNKFLDKAASVKTACSVCGGEAGDGKDATTGDACCGSCMGEMVAVAAQDALTNGFGGGETEFLEANLGRTAAEQLLLDYTDPVEYAVAGRSAKLLFNDASGRYAQVEFSDGATKLVPFGNVEKVAQIVTQSFREKVRAAVCAGMGGDVEGLTITFSEHWSQRVTGQFTFAGSLYEYEYTQSTGRFIANKVGAEDYSEPQVEGYTWEKEATRHFSGDEQSVLQNESLGQMARNFDRLRTEGTHYQVGEVGESHDDLNNSALFL